ncbi:MAG: ATP-binding protein [Thermodesulfobacteriota bacterium]
MTFHHKVGFKLGFIYVLSLILALSAVLVVAESIISQQVHKRHQKKLEVLSEKVFYSLEKQKDQMRLLSTAMANFGRMGPLTAREEKSSIRTLLRPIFKESDIDILFVTGQEWKELVRMESEQFAGLKTEERNLIKKTLIGTQGARLGKWEQGVFIGSSAPVYNEEDPVGRVYSGTLIDHTYLDELAKGMDAFMAIVGEGKVIAGTFTKKGEGDNELEFSGELLQDIKALMDQPLSVVIEDKAYTMKSLPLRNRSGDIISYLVIGLSRGELNQTVKFLRRTILGVGGGGAFLGVLLMVLLTSGLRKQIALLSKGTEKVASGEATEVIPSISRDELGALAESFNQMARTLEERDRVLQEEKKKILANVDFLSMLVHDVKAPMAGVRLMLESLLEENLSSEIKRQLTGMGESIEELLGHLYNVLAISKIEKGPFNPKLEAVDLNASVIYVTNQCRIIADRKGIQIREDLDQTLPVLEADEFYLERLIYNLLANALHWTPPQGWIEVKTGRENQREARGIILEITDSGPGISPQQRPFLFDKYIFNQEKGDLNGTHSGLGLHICRTIVQAHGGTIEETGRPGEGARFRCFFPLDKSADHPKGP